MKKNNGSVSKILKFWMLIILALSVPFKTNAQIYREQFDKLDQLNYPDNLLNSSNFGERIHNVTHYLMRSYVLMYKATGDVKYLEKFIITSKRVMDRRDDNWENCKNYMDLPVTIKDTNDNVCTIGVTTNQIDVLNKSWARILSPATCILNDPYMEVGTITSGMAEFILVMQEHPELNNLALPLEALSSTPGLNSYSGATVLNFKQYSDWLTAKVYESLDWVIDRHYTPYLPSELLNGTSSNGINQQAAVGRTLLLMYRVWAFESLGVNRLYYKQIAQRLGTHVWNTITDPAIGPLPTLANSKPWFAWCDAKGCANSEGGWEDITHSWLEIEMLDEMSEQGIPTSYGSLFNASVMEKFANGVLYRMCSEPKTITMNVYGNNSTCWECNGNLQPSNYYFAGGLVFLSKYNKGVYQAVSDIYSPNQVIDGTINSVFGWNGWNGKLMLGLSQLAYYQNLFNPITVKSGTSLPGDNWRAAVTGDFDGNGSLEIAAAAINEIYIYSVNSSNIISQSASTVGEIVGPWRGLASGEFIGSIAGDEIVAVSDNNLEILKIGYPPLAIKYGTTQQFKGVIVGDFDVMPGKEIIVANNSDGKLYMYRYDGTNIVGMTLLNNFVGNNITGLAIGDFNGDGQKNEIAVSTNADGAIKIYSIAGGTLIQNASSFAGFSNQYGLTAGNFDGDVKDELILYRKLDDLQGAFQIFKLGSATNIDFKGEELFSLNQLNGVMCSTKISSHTNSDVLATFRNYDAQISIFNMDGLCKSLYLTSQNINSATTLGNNYPIDYHVNNILTAGNGFTIASGSLVDMTAGKAIVFTPGFTSETSSVLYAHIDGGIACANSFFRQGSSSTSASTPSSASQKSMDNNLNVYPNPNNGLFVLGLGNETQKNIYVYDVTGKMVYERKGVTDSNINIDLRNEVKGIYIVRVTDDKTSTTLKVVKE